MESTHPCQAILLHFWSAVIKQPETNKVWLTEFFRPVWHEGGGTCNNAFLNRCLACLRGLFEKCPHQSYTLKLRKSVNSRYWDGHLITPSCPGPSHPPWYTHLPSYRPSQSCNDKGTEHGQLPEPLATKTVIDAPSPLPLDEDAGPSPI